jgi:hypothetical protein
LDLRPFLFESFFALFFKILKSLTLNSL